MLTNQLKEFGITVAGNLLPAIQSIAQTVGPAITALSGFANEHKELTTAAIAVVGGLVGIKLAVAATTWVVSGVAGAFNLVKAAFAGFAAVSKLAAAGQWVLNAAMSANPIGIVVTAVGALVGGMIYLYNTCEPVRAVFDKVFSFIGEKVSWAWDKIKAVGGALKAVGKFLGFGNDNEDENTAKVAESVKPVAQKVEVSQADMLQLYGANGMPIPTVPLNPTATPATVPTASGVETTNGDAGEAQKTGQAEKSQSVPQPQPMPQMPDMQEILRKMQGSAKGQSSPLIETQAKDQNKIVQPQVQVSINVTQNGVPDQTFAQGVMNAIKSRQSEFEQIISALVNEQARLAYGD